MILLRATAAFVMKSFRSPTFSFAGTRASDAHIELGILNGGFLCSWVRDFTSGRR